MSKRNKTKLTWKEMNLKQRILFVIDWIMRGILMVTIVLFIVAIGMNCADRNKSSESCVYAYENLSVLEPSVSVESVLEPSVSVDSDLSNVLYNSYNFSDVSSSNGRIFEKWFENFPLSSPITCVLVPISWSSDIFLLRIAYNITYSSASYFNLQLSDGNYYTTFDLSSIVLISNSFLFQILCDQSVSVLSFNLYFYFGSYSPGFAQGLAAGLEQGKQEGIQSVTDSFSGIFFKSVLNVSATYYDNVSDSTYVKSFAALTPNFGFNTVLFNSTYNYLVSAANDPSNDDLQSATVTISLDQPFSYNPDRPFYISGSSRSDIFDITLVDINGKRYSGTFNSDANYFAQFPASTGIDNAAAISSIIIFFGRASDTMSDAALTQDSGGYFQGYNLGLADGIDQGYSDGRTEGISIGYDQGYQAGFDSAGVGGFSWLIGSVQSFLDTKFFGDFGVGTLLYVGLGIALATLFIKFFAGG